MSNYNYYESRKANVTERINEEIAFYDKCLYAKSLTVIDYSQYLKSRIGADKIDYPTIMHYDNSGNKQEIKKMNLDEHLKEIDINTFSRPWAKLREIHKIMKIKEYIDNLEYNKKIKAAAMAKNRESIKREICLGLKTKKFSKHKSIIDYDQENMVILSISCIDYNKKTHLYEIDWDL